jgi:hypothetical protein
MKGITPNRSRGHIPATTDPKVIAELARAIDTYGTYDRTTSNEDRRNAMQAWADYIDQLKADDKKVTLIIKDKAA